MDIKKILKITTLSGISDRKLANHAGCHAQTLSYIRTGKTDECRIGPQIITGARKALEAEHDKIIKALADIKSITDGN